MPPKKKRKKQQSIPHQMRSDLNNILLIALKNRINLDCKPQITLSDVYD